MWLHNSANPRSRFGEQQSTLKKKHDKEGILKEKINPGDLVLSDRYMSSLPDQYFSIRSQTSSHHEYRGGALFTHATNEFIHISNQVGFIATESVKSKLRFVREATYGGVQVKKYSTDNGVYQSKDFFNNHKENNQTKGW